MWSTHVTVHKACRNATCETVTYVKLKGHDPITLVATLGIERMPQIKPARSILE